MLLRLVNIKHGIFECLVNLWYNIFNAETTQTKKIKEQYLSVINPSSTQVITTADLSKLLC